MYLADQWRKSGYSSYLGVQYKNAAQAGIAFYFFSTVLWVSMMSTPPSHTDTHRHTDTQTHRHTDTNTHRHTHRHKHTDTHTHTHRHTQTHTDTHRHTHRHTDTHRHRHTHRPAE